MRLVFAMAVAAAAMFFLFAPRGRAEGACADEVEYEVTADMKITDTPLGEGNGVFAVGPGRVVLRFEGADVKMTTYAMHAHVVDRREERRLHDERDERHEHGGDARMRAARPRKEHCREATSIGERRCAG